MKYNAINLIRRGADSLRDAGDCGSAFALHELANNLILLMRGNVSLADWCGCYTADGCEALDLDEHLPPVSYGDRAC